MKERPATPYLLVDANVVEQNIVRLAEYSVQTGLGVRPHIKTHKSRHVAAMQLKYGAVGLTVAKLGEAQVMAREVSDLLIAYPLIDQARTERATRLALHHTVRVAVDSVAAVDAIGSAARAAAATVGILVDLDVGMHRTGVATAEQALRLAQLVDQAAGLRFDGLFCYPGHIVDKADQQAEPLKAVGDALAETLDLWGQHGLEAKIVSGGSTPTAFQSHLVPDLTEIRPGTYVMNDMNIVRGGFCSLNDCAARIICTVVSDAASGQVIVDAGSKTLTSDRCGSAPDSGHGFVVEYPNAKITWLNEEHGMIDVTACDARPSIGSQLSIIPNHICVCFNLQDRFWWQEE
ncbi:MAG: alanine racemase, partial [Pirellulales bacterium]